MAYTNTKRGQLISFVNRSFKTFGEWQVRRKVEATSKRPKPGELNKLLTTTERKVLDTFGIDTRYEVTKELRSRWDKKNPQQNSDNKVKEVLARVEELKGASVVCESDVRHDEIVRQVVEIITAYGD